MPVSNRHCISQAMKAIVARLKSSVEEDSLINLSDQFESSIFDQALQTLASRGVIDVRKQDDNLLYRYRIRN